jgi:hypothetical protein
MPSDQATMAPLSSRVRRTRSARMPITTEPTTPTTIMAAGSRPMAVSLIPNSSWMPSTAWARAMRSAASTATVAASAATGTRP